MVVSTIRPAFAVALVIALCWSFAESADAAASAIRVLLASDVQRVEVRSERAFWLSHGTGRGRSFDSSAQVSASGPGFEVNGRRIAAEQLTLRGGDKGLNVTVVSMLPAVAAAGTGNGRGTSVDAKSVVHVSGLVHLLRRGKGFLVINQVDLEEYVKGVVPAEVNSAWHLEMLKVQAVAARTYALYHHMLSAGRDYDVAASIQDQVYRGRQGIDARVERAVEETRGLVVTYQDAPIYAAFSSTAAGLTEDAMNVWSKDLPYLKGVECPFDLESPYYQWKASFKLETLERNLRRLGFGVGTITALAPLSYSRAGRVAKLTILHSGGELILRGEDLRKAVGYTVVPSTQFTIESVGPEVVLSGYGAGHAVGLCQWGAKELAELGYSFGTILQYYYPGTELQNAALTKSPVPPPS